MKGESVQAVYQDIRRLLALGFPGESGDLFETIGRDAFLTALADPALRIRVLDQHPRTLDDALAVVVRMEAYGPNSVSDDDNVERKRVRVVSPVRESEADRRIRELEKRVECQNKEIQRLKQTTNRGNDRPQQQSNTGSRPVWGNRGSNGGPDVVPHGGADGGLSTAREGGPCAARDATYIPHDSGPAAVRNGGPNGGPGHAPGFLGNHPVASGVGPQAGWQPANLYYADSQYTAAPANTPPWQQQRQWTRRPPVPGGSTYSRRASGRRPYDRVPRDTCSFCKQRGHWRVRCPILNSNANQAYTDDAYYDGFGQNTDFYSAPSTVNVQAMSSKGLSDTYIDVSVRGRTVASLLDTGCERNICPLRLCKNAIISPVKAELFAANGSPIRIVGATRLFFEIQGMPLHADVFVTEEIDEMIFGYEFLVQNNCIWTFGQCQITLTANRSRYITDNPKRLCAEFMYVNRLSFHRTLVLMYQCACRLLSCTLLRVIGSQSPNRSDPVYWPLGHCYHTTIIMRPFHS